MEDYPLAVGQKFNIFYGEGNPSNRKIEVRAIVDGKWIVIRRRDKKNCYSIEPRCYFDVLQSQGFLRLVYDAARNY